MVTERCGGLLTNDSCDTCESLEGGAGELHLGGQELAISEEGAGAMIAAGYEVYQGRAFAVDLALRTAAVSYEESDTVTQTAATVGVNWY